MISQVAAGRHPDAVRGLVAATVNPRDVEIAKKDQDVRPDGSRDGV